ncbi:glycosyltransferase family 2 protein [Shewanella atlantica]|uniref:Glycosyltransferase family 2 protein n=1 Tax=Shewanella atlantica TaxID=271099 RepID=A0A431WB25_9GAMM|nr:glycosyltransferase family 2 protein [Shewanella atlantica]RTR32539.1 glycosyltransferase family 2 protein [Shewanella atlantica]
MESLVSIIMPSYNSAKTIAQSIDSVLAQKYRNWELLITDDKSSDDTLAIINKYRNKDKRIRLFENEINLGAGGSRNRSIKEAGGKYIAFLDSDDLWLADKLSIQIGYMQKNNVALSYTWYQKFGNHGDGGFVEPRLTVTYQQILYSNIIGCLTAVYDAELLGKRFMPLIRKRQDMGLWLDILKDIDMAKGVPQVLAKYRIDSGMTQNKIKVLKWQWLFYREVAELSVVSSLRYFIVYTVLGFLKYKK